MLAPTSDMIEDAMYFPETGFVENPLAVEDIYAHFVDLNDTSSPMYDDEPQHDASAYFADDEDSYSVTQT
jgi:hypothetical protein